MRRNYNLHVDSYPYLGVTISSDLRWHKHVNSVSPKATRTLTFVQRNIYRCLPDVKTLAYTLLIRPHLEFASAAWSTLPVTSISWTKYSVVLHVL